MSRMIIKSLFFVVLLCLFSIAKSQNYGIYLNGAATGTSVVKIPALNIASLPVTIEAWFKPEGAQNDYASVWFTRGTSPEITGMFMRSSINNELRSNFQNTGSTTATSLVVTNDVWHHAALVVTSTSKILYLDGVAYNYGTGTNSNCPFSVITYLGYDNAVTTRTFKGIIDEVRIWTTARTAQQLADNKYATLAGNETGLKGYWNFNDRNASRATDLTSNARHGTLVGSSYVTSNYADPMAYSSSTTSQTSAVVSKNTLNNLVMQLQVVTVNSRQPANLTSITFNTTGSTNPSDIAAARVYYTGSSATFSPVTLFGTVNSPSGSFNVTGSQPLVEGNNYFWLVYDVSSVATDGHLLDAQCTSLTMVGANSETKSPTVTNPTGALTVNNNVQVATAKLPVETVTTSGATPSGGANFVSFQQSAITTFNGYQYVAYWSTNYRVCLARRKIPVGTWQSIEFTDHTVDLARVSDNHYSISMGICPNDGTIHVCFDQHGENLKYKKSVVGLATNPETVSWSVSSFGAKQDYLIAGNVMTDVTYPRFLARPDGNLFFEYRKGTSGGGDSYLYLYNASTGLWKNQGKYLDGLSLDPDQNGYINGIHYDKNGRLHVSWVWRVTPDANTNHDIYYGYSDDNGMTWKNSSGTTVATINTNPMTLGTSGLNILTIAQNRGLINQESQVVDSRGRIHILNSYMVDAEPNASDFRTARSKAYLRHIYLDENKVWHYDNIGVVSQNRSQIACDENDNIYVVCPNFRVYTASSANNWQTWKALDITEPNSGINEGLIDRELLMNENVLSFVFAQTGNKIIVPYYVIEKQKASTGTGLREAYYNDTAFTYLMYQNHNKIDYNWENNAPNPVTNRNYFSVQWDGYAETRYAEPYTLYFTSSGATRVWVNDILVIDALNNTTSKEFITTLSLQPSHKYKIKIQTAYSLQSALARLEWSSLQQSRQVIPATSLYSIASLTPHSDYTFSIPLNAGWNMVSMNFIPIDKSIKSVFPHAQIIQTSDAFYSAQPSGRENTLTSIESGKVYIVKNAIAETLQIAGNPQALDAPVSLSKGIQLLLYPYYNNSSIANFTSGISSQMNKIKNLSDFYIYGSSGNVLRNFEKTKGYYIDVSDNCVLQW